MEFVATRFRDDVDDAAERPAVLRLVAARLDLDLLDELVVDGLPLNPLEDVGRVDAVDDPLVLGGRRPIDRQRERTALCIAPIGRDPGVRPHDVGIVARGRQPRDHPARVVGSPVVEVRSMSGASPETRTCSSVES